MAQKQLHIPFPFSLHIPKRRALAATAILVIIPLIAVFAIRIGQSETPQLPLEVAQATVAVLLAEQKAERSNAGKGTTIYPFELTPEGLIGFNPAFVVVKGATESQYAQVYLVRIPETWTRYDGYSEKYVRDIHIGVRPGGGTFGRSAAVSLVLN